MSAAPASGLHSQGRCLTSIISILEREHEGGFGHSSPSRNTATVPPDALCGRGRARGEVATPNSLQLHHDCAFRDSWSGHTSFAGILGDPLSCCPSALVGTSLVLVDRDREPSASGAHEGIAHETFTPRMRLSTSPLFFSKRSKSVWLPRTQIRAYRWCSPPRTGCATMSPNRSIGRPQGAAGRRRGAEQFCRCSHNHLR